MVAHHGIAVAYKRALRLTRRIYVSAVCRAAHPDGMLALRRMVELGRCDTAGSRCRMERTWETFQGRASHRSDKGRREYVALVTPEEMNQYPYNTMLRVCRRQTFGAFGRDIVHIIQSRGPRLAGGVMTRGSVTSESPGGGPGIRNPPTRHEHVGMFPLLRSHCSIGFDLAAHLRITFTCSSLSSSSRPCHCFFDYD
jgi:hypothetical protein